MSMQIPYRWTLQEQQDRKHFYEHTRQFGLLDALDASGQAAESAVCTEPEISFHIK